MRYNEKNKQINYQAGKFEIPLTNILISKPCLNPEKKISQKCIIYFQAEIILKRCIQGNDKSFEYDFLIKRQELSSFYGIYFPK